MRWKYNILNPLQALTEFNLLYKYYTVLKYIQY
jgi:hypothetical protein